MAPLRLTAMSLHEYFRGRELTAGEWDESRSRMFGHLDRYQREAYWSLMKIAQSHGGAFLCDGVGLGKTFVGLMLIERLVLHENKRVVLFAPKAAREGVWEPHLRGWLPHIGGVGGSADFSNLTILSHTDLHRGGAFPERFERIAELADAVIVDEAHHFRNRGSRGKPDDEGDRRSRAYAKASQLAEGGEGTAFPDRKAPRVADYSIRSSYGELLDMFTDAFEKENPLFSLAIYYPLAYYTGPDDSIDPLEEGRQRQVVGLIRTLFLKRFESSAFAFQKSLDLLMRKLLAFMEVHSETDDERDRFESWKRRHAEVIRRFSPYYNGSSSADLVSRGDPEIRVLVSTDQRKPLKPRRPSPSPSTTSNAIIPA